MPPKFRYLLGDTFEAAAAFFQHADTFRSNQTRIRGCTARGQEPVRRGSTRLRTRHKAASITQAYAKTSP